MCIHCMDVFYNSHSGSISYIYFLRPDVFKILVLRLKIHALKDFTQVSVQGFEKNLCVTETFLKLTDAFIFTVKCFAIHDLFFLKYFKYQRYIFYFCIYYL